MQFNALQAGRKFWLQRTKLASSIITFESFFIYMLKRSLNFRISKKKDGFKEHVW